MSGAVAIGSNRLAALAAEIREADGRFRRSSLEAAHSAINAGNALIEAKALVKHKQWLPWLRDNVAMSERSANRYMRLARSGLNPPQVADLGIGAADEALAKHMPDYDFGIPINAVRFVPEYYPRASFDLEYVRELSEVLDELPPIEVNQDNELIDGRYRWEAHKAAGMRRIRVIVTQTIDRSDLLTLWCERNSRHGFRQSEADRERNAVRRQKLDEAAGK